MTANSKVTLLVCGGIGRIVSTVVRQAAYMVASDRPEHVALVSSGSLTGDVPEALDAARTHRLFVVDACQARIAHITGEVFGKDAKKLAVGASQRASQQGSPEAPNG